MSLRALAFGAPLLATIVLACTSGLPASGAGEPLFVHGGTLEEGALPGTPPLTAEEVDGGAEPTGTHVTGVDSINNILRPGESDKALGGHATKDSASVAIRFPDLGSGYWILPVDGPDPAAEGALTWSMRVDFAHDLPRGLRELHVAAVDQFGHAGTQYPLAVCVDGPIPDNLNACDPTIAPPEVVLSLSWDTDVDLDLQVLTPQGKLVDAKHPTTALTVDGGVTPDPTKEGAIDHDSNAGCAGGSRRENLVWQEKPARGHYIVYANLFSACGQASTRFTAALYTAESAAGAGDAGATYTQVEASSTSGELLSGVANGGSAVGLFVTEFFID